MHEQASWPLWASNTQDLIKLRDGNSVGGVRGCGWVWGGVVKQRVGCVEFKVNVAHAELRCFNRALFFKFWPVVLTTNGGAPGATAACTFGG